MKHSRCVCASACFVAWKSEHHRLFNMPSYTKIVVVVITHILYNIYTFRLKIRIARSRFPIILLPFRVQLSISISQLGGPRGPRTVQVLPPSNGVQQHFKYKSNLSNANSSFLFHTNLMQTNSVKCNLISYARRNAKKFESFIKLHIR